MISDEMSKKFKKALRIAVNVGCGFEGDAEDAAELLTLITGLESRIAELSQAVGLITTLKPTMVMDANHPLDMVREVGEHVTARIAELEAEVTKCHELQDSYCDRIAEIEAAQRWIRTKVKLPDRAVRQFYEVVCLHQDFAELALFSKGRWIIYDGTSVYDITDRVVFWRRRQPLPAEVMDVLNKRQELQ